MIADAVDTAITLGWALLVWIVLTAAAGTLALWTVVAVAWWAGRTAWAAIGPRRAPAARVSDEQPSRDPRPPERAERHPRPHRAPSWANTQPIKES